MFCSDHPYTICRGNVSVFISTIVFAHPYKPFVEKNFFNSIYKCFCIFSFFSQMFCQSWNNMPTIWNSWFAPCRLKFAALQIPAQNRKGRRCKQFVCHGPVQRGWSWKPAGRQDKQSCHVSWFLQMANFGESQQAIWMLLVHPYPLNLGFRGGTWQNVTYIFWAVFRVVNCKLKSLRYQKFTFGRVKNVS